MSLWDPIFGASAVAAELDDDSWVRAMLDVEGALARACAGVGLVDETAAETISRACAEPSWLDPRELGERAATDGNPVIPLVRALRERVGDAGSAVHFGATSQDILDTAAMLVTSRAQQVILTDLLGAANAAAALAGAYRDTPMAARTLLQQAVPTTFGALAAVWGTGLDRTAAGLAATELPVQLGGAAGTLAGWHPHGPAVRAVFAAELRLADPGAVWHAERSRVGELAGALGVACGAIGKAATDVVLLAQTDVGEVREAASGGSSAMAHKANPVAAITARAAAAQAPGLVATLLAAMPGELQRAAGSWHAEWRPLTALLTATGGAAARLRTSLTGLAIDTGAMARNLARLDGIVDTSDLGHAVDLVDAYLHQRGGDGER